MVRYRSDVLREDDRIDPLSVLKIEMTDRIQMDIRLYSSTDASDDPLICLIRAIQYYHASSRYTIWSMYREYSSPHDIPRTSKLENLCHLKRRAQSINQNSPIEKKYYASTRGTRTHLSFSFFLLCASVAPTLLSTSFSKI